MNAYNSHLPDVSQLFSLLSSSIAQVFPPDPLPPRSSHGPFIFVFSFAAHLTKHAVKSSAKGCTTLGKMQPAEGFQLLPGRAQLGFVRVACIIVEIKIKIKRSTVPHRACVRRSSIYSPGHLHLSCSPSCSQPYVNEPG